MEAIFIHQHFNPASATHGNSLSKLRHTRHPSISAQFMCAMWKQIKQLSTREIHLCQLNLCAPRVETNETASPREIHLCRLNLCAPRVETNETVSPDVESTFVSSIYVRHMWKQMKTVSPHPASIYDSSFF